MEINLPPTDESRLAVMAKEAGFADVSEFVAQHVQALAQSPTPDSLTEEELAASLKMCDTGMAQAEAGEGLSVDEALNRNLARLRQLRQ